MNAPPEITLIAVLAGIACALPGMFLLLRRQAMVSDAVSHVVLLGIVVGYLIVGRIESPWLLVGAALTGVLTVFLVETLQRTRLVKEDAAVGLVFPALFSLAIILGTWYTSGVHLDADSVMLGQLLLAADFPLVVGGYDLGPFALWTVGTALVLDLAFLVVFWKELKLATFDPALAAASGLRPVLLHYALMALVSLTAVAAFDAVGPALAVALMVVPPATVYLLTDRLSVLAAGGAAVGAGCAAVGVEGAFVASVSPAGAIAAALGLAFLVAFLFAPGRGLLAGLARRRRQRREFHDTMLAVHLLQHEGTPEEAEESRAATLHEHLHWPAARAARVVRRALRRGLVAEAGGQLHLADAGRDLARGVLGLDR